MWILNRVDRLNYSTTPNFLLSVWVTLGIVWLFMGSTTCGTSNKSDVPADSCLAKLYYRDPTSRSDPLDINNYKKISAYDDTNWFPLVVILAYMVPIFVWYGAMGSTWYRLWKKIDALKVSKDAPDSPDEDTCAVGKELFDWIKTRSGDLRASKYLFTRVVAALMTFLAFCLIAVFVGGHLFWPLELVETPVFPAKTTCYKETWKRRYVDMIGYPFLTEKHTDFITCTHPMSDWYTFAFVIQWLWFAAATVINCIDLFSACEYWSTPDTYESTIRGYLDKEDKEAVDAFLKFLKKDGILVFTILTQNCKPPVTQNLLRRLLVEYQAKAAEDIV